MFANNYSFCSILREIYKTDARLHCSSKLSKLISSNILVVIKRKVFFSIECVIFLIDMHEIDQKFAEFRKLCSFRKSKFRKLKKKSTQSRNLRNQNAETLPVRASLAGGLLDPLVRAHDPLEALVVGRELPPNPVELRSLHVPQLENLPINVSQHLTK